MRRTFAVLLYAAALASATALTAQDKPVPPAKPVFDADGTVHVPAFDLPPSAYLTPEALAFQKMRAKMGGTIPPSDVPIAAMRKGLAAILAPQITALNKKYPVDIADSMIGGVPTKVFTPKGKAADKRHVLINLHGGAFSVCWDSCAMLESIPISALGGYKVVSVNYRMGPEAKHPAALEDIEAVYRDLLKSYKPSQIAIYGCSAGGALSAEMGAWLPKHGLPQPAALGIFGAGGVRFGLGDSAYYAGYVDGSFGQPPKPGDEAPDMTRGYFDGANMDDPVISPALHPDVIAKFPPTLLITGTRAMDMSPAIYTNAQLLKAGVQSTLLVGEGMGHCYIMNDGFPEAHDAWNVMLRFFKTHLK